MSYQPKTWENKPSTASPINATNLNHMEGGIKTNDDNIVDAQNAILTLQGEMLQAQGDISALETLADSIFPVDTESGNPAVITDAFGGSCKSLKLTLEPIQASGTPSPNDSLPISGRTQAKITRGGKNYFDKTTITSGYSINENGELTNTDGFAISDYIPVNANADYVANGLMTTLSPWNFRIHAYDASKQWLSQIGLVTITQNYPSPFDFTTPNGTAYIRLSIGITNRQNINLLQILSKEDFVNYTISLGQTVYSGVPDVTTGALTIYNALITLDGSVDENIAIFGTRIAVAIPNDSMTWTDPGAVTGKLLSNRYVESTNHNTYSGGVGIHYRIDGSHSIILSNGSDSGLDTVEKWRTWLSNNNVQVLYWFATPVTVQLTAEEVTLLKGDNVLTTDADSIDVEYSADIALYIAKKIAEGISQGNRSLSKGGVSEEEPKEEEKEVVEIKEEEPLTKEVR